LSWFYELTGWILSRQPKPDYLNHPMNALLPAALVRIARGEIGVMETNGTNCGPRVNEYKAATTLDPTQDWPWCAAFLCWLVREAMRATGIQETATFKRPTTAGAWPLESWSRAQDLSTQTLRKQPGKPFDIQPGDLILFTFSHCGLAITAPDNTGHFLTIEGNTDDNGSREGGAVLRRTRRTLQVKTRIRFRV
jgi:hypothetical protein